MPSAIYELFRQAILGRKQIICSYQGCDREICPHILGHKDGEEKALAYQFAGQSNSRLPPGGEWRCLLLSEVRGAQLRDGRWHSEAYHRKSQSCVEVVDVDVNIPETLVGVDRGSSDRGAEEPRERGE
jgi:hypothetical protein